MERTLDTNPADDTYDEERKALAEKMHALALFKANDAINTSPDVKHCAVVANSSSEQEVISRTIPAGQRGDRGTGIGPYDESAGFAVRAIAARINE